MPVEAKGRSAELVRGVPGFQPARRLDSGVVFLGNPMSLDTAARERATAHLRDRLLITELHDGNSARGLLPETSWGMKFRNPELAGLARQRYTSKEIGKIGEVLKENGGLDLFIMGGEVVVDQKKEEVQIVKATAAETHGDMSSKVWIRDQDRVGKSYFEAWLYKKFLGFDSQDYWEDGKMAHDILVSTMHLMSTQPQLARFTTIIRDENKHDPKKALAADYREWPQIAMELTPDKLGSETPTDWRHPQDAWQMLGITLLDAIDHRLIKPDELKEGNKQFFASMMPFLAAVNFSEVENCGPWEEVRARRTSVIGIETRLLHKLLQHMNEPGFEFLAEGFDKEREHLPDDIKDKSFEDALDTMIKKGLTTIGEQLPFESPAYDKDSIKYREADASLLNLLDFDIPELLVEYNIPIKRAEDPHPDERYIEDMILEQVDRLYDPVTHGYRRYGVPGQQRGRDTYLGPGYNLNENLLRINGEHGLKQHLKAEADGGQINLDKKAKLREEIVSEGDAAAWVIPATQKADWATRKLLHLLIKKSAGIEVEDADVTRYEEIATPDFNNTLANVTGKEFQPILNGKGYCEIKEIGQYLLPESWWRTVADGDIWDIVPSPNVPLNWNVGLMTELLTLYQLALQQKEKLGLAA